MDCQRSAIKHDWTCIQKWNGPSSCQNSETQQLPETPIGSSPLLIFIIIPLGCPNISGSACQPVKATALKYHQITIMVSFYSEECPNIQAYLTLHHFQDQVGKQRSDTVWPVDEHLAPIGAVCTDPVYQQQAAECSLLPAGSKIEFSCSSASFCMVTGN